MFSMEVMNHILFAHSAGDRHHNLAYLPDTGYSVMM